MDTKEIKEQLKTKPGDKSLYKYYEPTDNRVTGQDDDIDDPLVFNFPKPLKNKLANKCLKTNPGCSECVHKVDSWCKDNAWDESCQGKCEDRHCVNVCGAPKPALVNLNTDGASVYKTWVTEGEVAAWSMHSTHQLGARSYSYAPDEFERHLEKTQPEALGDCKLDSHKEAQTAAGFLEEAQHLHHTGKPRGFAAAEYAKMIKDAYAEAETSFVEAEATTTLEQAKTDAATLAECKAMAGGKDYEKVFRCETDQPRFWISWLGRKRYQFFMQKSNQALKKAVMQDACCQAKYIEEGKCSVV
jgi:hypothetical protein